MKYSRFEIRISGLRTPLCKALCRVKEIDINIGEARSTQTIVNLYPITSVVIVYQIICEL